MALLLAQARNVPQAHAALKAGPLGALAVGGRRAGRQDARHRRPRPHRQARRPAGPGLRHAPRRLRPVRVAPTGPARWASSCCRSTQVVAEADFLTIHLPKTTETIGLIGNELLAKAKPDAARHQRGPRRHRRRGRRWPRPSARASSAGAALDVFATEPTTESPLFELDQRRRHARTSGRAPARRRTRPATPSPSMVQLALAGEFVPFAVNVDAAEASETVRPFLPLAERLGRLFASLAEGVPVDGRGLLRGRARRLRHPHPHPGGAEGLVRRRSATSR